MKTVGDLSALTPSEVRTLPIRSPKVSNVKKALRVYEQQVRLEFAASALPVQMNLNTLDRLQRKGRGVDELKSFTETEMMTSEPEEACPRNQDEEKASGETLGTRFNANQ